ncbi:MAG: NAD(P)H-dependent oxidoreductase [Bacteroidales bacterium]|nr:NAD(P)H-dependent oxidoreductase [Bacteroidales bacterium]
MKKIIIISSSIREGRLGHRVSLFLKNYLIDNSIADAEIIDLNEYKFPLFEERLFNMPNPPANLLNFVNRFKNSDGVIIASSVYNYSFPASLKNAIDVMYPEWKRKVVALSSATMGFVEGVPTTFQLENTLSQMGAFVSPIKYFAINISKVFNEDGSPVDKEKEEKKIKPMIDEFMFLIGKLTD